MKRRFFQSASVYMLGDILLINPYARTRDGVRTGMALIATASRNDSAAIGKQLLAMLHQCKDNIPDDYAGGPSPAIAVLMKTAKQRSWRAFHARAVSVNVFRELQSDVVRITPSRREGGGSVPIEEKVRCSSTDPLELGSTVLAALSEAT
jgi:hypothetical protein